MKYIVWFVFVLCALNSVAADTLYVEDFKDQRYLRYLDSAKAYEIGYSVARNIADTIKNRIGNNSLDAYFLGRYHTGNGTESDGYYYDYIENPQVEIGHVNVSFKGIKNDSLVPWQYVELQYKRLDALKVKPQGLIQGAELPNVYVYAKPGTVVIYQKVMRYTVIDPAIKFFKKDDGKTKVSYILKYYYSKVNNGHEQIDSIEKLDPIYQKHISF
ncbi:MAG: hypothetical protein U0T74_11950 [Chitinophagales bacterium]